MASPLGKIVLKLCHDRGVSQRQIAETAEIDPSNFSKIIAGKLGTKGPMRRRIALAFGIPYKEFDEMVARAEGSPKPDEASAIERPAGMIPVINSAPAGAAVNYEEYGTDSRDGFRYIDRGSLRGDRLFAVEVVGDSMVPNIHPGDEIVFRHVQYNDEDPEEIPEGWVVYVCFSNDAPRSGCTIARWYADGEQVTLKKDNPKHKPVTYAREHIGQVAKFVQRRTSKV